MINGKTLYLLSLTCQSMDILIGHIFIKIGLYTLHRKIFITYIKYCFLTFAFREQRTT